MKRKTHQSCFFIVKTLSSDLLEVWLSLSWTGCWSMFGRFGKDMGADGIFLLQRFVVLCIRGVTLLHVFFKR